MGKEDAEGSRSMKTKANNNARARERVIVIALVGQVSQA